MKMKITKKITDMKNLSWTKTRQSSGTAGSYLKSYSYQNGLKVYYKLPYFDEENQIFGYEAFNEIIAAKICEKLSFNHLDYNLINAEIMIKNNIYNAYLNYSYDFKKINESKITFENYYEINKEKNENIIDFCIRNDFIEDIYNIIILDYLILNRDRHGANVEILYNHKKQEYRLAPIFDNGLSLLSPAYQKEQIAKYNIDDNKKVISFIGPSLEENIKLVPKDKLQNINFDVDDLFDEIRDILDETYMEKAKSLIKRRLKEIENLCC